MLSNREQDLLRGFFKEMPFEDVADVAKLITKKNLIATSHEDAICIICQHSKCVEEILEKRKVTKRYLCEYLHRSKVSILNSWDKPALIRKTLNFWKLDASSSSHTNDSIENTLPEQNQTTLQTSLQVPPEALRGDEYYSTLCHEFSKWYYTLLNDDDVNKLGPEHFFDESQMQVALLSGDSTNTIEAQNSSHAAETLRGLKVQYNLKFLPNLAPGGLQFEHDIHGQVKLFVSGTLHSHLGQVVGVFEQKFLLIRDFADNENWKIKKSQVVLRSANNAIQSASTSTSSDTNIFPLCSSSGALN